jgi:molecular chaperone HscB
MLDVQDLERRYRDLSRQFHPDYFHNAPSADRLASLERSSYLNDAYRTLRNPIGRVEYLLTLEGRPLSTSGEEPGESTAKAPAAMLAEVFALNEELDEIREAREAGSALDDLRSRLAAARRPIDARREQHERTVLELSERWDGLSDAAPQRSEVLDALREQVLARHYISNLLATIEREATAIERSALGDATLADVAAPGTTDQEPSRRG